MEQLKLVPGERTLRTAISHFKDIPFHSPLQSQDRKMDVTETGAPGSSTVLSCDLLLVIFCSNIGDSSGEC